MSRSESRLELRGREVRAVVDLNLLELGGVDGNGDGRISYDELEGSIERIVADFRRHYTVAAPDAPGRTTIERYDLVEDHVLRMQIVYVFPHDVDRLDIQSTLSSIMPAGHQHLVTVRLGGVVHQAVLGAGGPTTVQFTAEQASYGTVFRSFFTLGVRHIVGGYDHLAFLICLMIGAASVRSLILITTAFTLAHSLTLALATFDVLILPSRVTESLIAVSILYLAIENLRQRKLVGRYQIAFLFGLVHGLGFSSVFREVALSRGSLAVSLFSLNAGVEIGQVAVVLAMFPLLAYLALPQWSPLKPAVSLTICGLSAYWFVERAFFN